jgi:dienelactone hydrolase
VYTIFVASLMSTALHELRVLRPAPKIFSAPGIPGLSLVRLAGMRYRSRMRTMTLALGMSVLVGGSAYAEIETREVSYEADGITMNGFMAWDAARSGKRPGVLVVHEWWGHNEYARQRARKLAALGYTALAVDMFGGGKTADHPQQAGEFAQAVFADLDGAETRFRAALAQLRAHPTVDAKRTAAIGYCFGGGIALHMARRGVDLDGVVSFHGSLGTQTPAKKGDIKAAILVQHGADDPFVKPETIQAFKQEMKAAGADLTFTAYPGAVHAFTNPGATALGKKFDLPLRYDEEADEKSWDAMQAFFRRVFASG